MNIFLRRHFPSSKQKFKWYLKLLLPMIIGSSLFALNGFVDNFMVGNLGNAGPASLAAVNSWTNIIMGIYVGTALSGGILLSQFYFRGDYKMAQQVARLRYLISIVFAFVFAAVAWTKTDLLIQVFLKSDQATPEAVIDYALKMDYARQYMKVIAIQWLLMAISFNLGNQLRETGFGFWTMVWGVGTLLTNITLNSVLMYGFSMETAGAAWASVASRLVAISVGITVIIWKKIEIGFNPITLFKISPMVIKLFLKRWFVFFSQSTVIFLVTMRSYFYSEAFPESSIGIGVGAMSIVGLTSAIMNVFVTTFSALASMSANVVASELGKGNIENAKRNADELKGFSTMIAFITSVFLVMVAFIIPYCNFLSKDLYDSSGTLIGDGHLNLVNVKWSLMIIAFMYPIWIWFSASYRCGLAGGNGQVFSAVDWIISGPIQIGWVAFLALFMVKGHESFWMDKFWLFYSMFFISDLLKLVFMEIFYYKYKWATQIQLKHHPKKSKAIKNK